MKLFVVFKPLSKFTEYIFCMLFVVLIQSLTRLQVQSKYPEVYESYIMQAAIPEAKYEEKLVSSRR